MLHAMRAQNRRRPIQRVALQVAAEVERDGAIAAADAQSVDSQVGDARPRGAPGSKRRWIGKGGLEVVGLEAPELDQRADARVEK